MDHRITQCPRCGTSFRVTEAHLAVAAGAVRCGSCLHIFNAREHWVEDKPAPAVEKEAPLSAQTVEEFEIDDDALFDDDTPLFAEDREPEKSSSGSIFNPIDDDFEAIDDSGPEQLTSNFIELNSWEQDTGPSFGDADNLDDEQPVNDESWTQKLLSDDGPPATAKAAPRKAIFEDFDAVLDAVPETEDSDDDSEIDALKEASEEAEFNAEFLEITAALDDRAAPSFASDNDRSQPPAEEVVAMDSLYATEPGAAGESNPLFKLNELGAEPLQLHQFVHEPRWPKVLWGLGFIAALALLAGQIIYANFNSLAHGPSRPWLARLCAVAGCTLPPQSDISLIRTSSLIVRSHPSQRGALAVDAIITNQAGFPQPYPVLQLQFSDMSGTAVASRRFTPQEYLAGELSGALLMPVQQPVHIALELVDPGPQAVNYALTVVPGAAP